MKNKATLLVTILSTLLLGCGQNQTPVASKPVAKIAITDPSSTGTVFTPIKSTAEKIDVSQLPSDVYALVNGKPITDTQIDKMLAQQPNVPESQKDIVKFRIGTFLINQLVIAQLVETGQIKVAPADLEKSQAKFQEILDKNNWTKEDFLERQKITESQLEQSIIMQAFLTSKVTDDRIEQMMDEIQDNIEQARTVDIILKGGPSLKSEDREKVKAEIEDLRQRALKGEDMRELAKKYSDDPSINQHEGRIGPITKRSYLVPQLQKTIFELKNIGDISEVINTEMGYMVVKLAEIMDNAVTAPNGRVVEARQMAESLALQRVQQEFHEVVRENNVVVRRPPPTPPNARPPMPPGAVPVPPPGQGSQGSQPNNSPGEGSNNN